LKYAKEQVLHEDHIIMLVKYEDRSIKNFSRRVLSGCEAKVFVHIWTWTVEPARLERELLKKSLSGRF
jgi:hypothetical protein